MILARTRTGLLVLLALSAACTGKKNTVPDAGTTNTTDAGPPDAGPSDGGVACIPQTPGPLDLYAVSSGNQVALAWVPRADDSAVTNYILGVLPEVDAGTCESSVDEQRAHQTTLNNLTGSQAAFRIVGLGNGLFAVAPVPDGGLPDGGSPPRLTSTDVSVALGTDAGFEDQTQVSATPADSLQVFAIDTARQIVVGRATNTVTALYTDSRGASFVPSGTFTTTPLGPTRASYDRSADALYICFSQGTAPNNAVSLRTLTQGGTVASNQPATGTGTPGTNAACDVLTVNGQVYVAYEDATNNAIWLVRSSDGFNNAIKIASTTTGLAYRPSLAWDNIHNQLVASFDMPRPGKVGKRDVEVSTSTDQGTTWSTPVLAYDDAANTNNIDVKNSRLAVDGVGGTIYVVFSKTDLQLSALGFSTDHGQSFVSGSDLVLGNDLAATPPYAQNISVNAAPDGKAWIGFTVSQNGFSVPYYQVFDPNAVVGTLKGVLGHSVQLGQGVQSGVDNGPVIGFDPALSIFATWQDVSDSSVVWRAWP
jgi:hypothetical protein